MKQCVAVLCGHGNDVKIEKFFLPIIIDFFKFLSIIKDI